MRFKLFLPLIAIFLMTLPKSQAQAPAPTVSPDSDWEFISDRDDILVYAKEIKGSPIVAFRGEGVIPANIAKVASILADIPKHPRWIPGLKKIDLLKKINLYERITYNLNHTPWPLKDRDFVIRSKVEVNTELKTIQIHFRSVKAPEVPTHGRVRGWLHHSKLTFTALDNGKTRATVEIHVDPKGSVPKWLVNHVQKAWPRHYLKGLMKEVSRKDLHEHPDVKKILLDLPGFDASTFAAR